MARYQVITLVDITRSNPNRSEPSNLKIGQQANFNSLIQAIGLRSNIDWFTDPKQCDGALPQGLDGKATYWSWDFDTERDYVFQKEDDPVGLLKDDLNGVPVVPELNNSVDITPACFISKGDNPNIWLYEITKNG
jgi:hypothetical protein